MNIEEMKRNAPYDATHYIKVGGFCYCKKINNQWLALEFGEWVVVDEVWFEDILPL